MKKLYAIALAILLALAIVGLGVAATSRTSRYIHARPGDRILTSHGYGCVIEKSGISCSHLRHTNLMATVTPRGVAIMLNNKVRFVCLNNGFCTRP